MSEAARDYECGELAGGQLAIVDSHNHGAWIKGPAVEVVP